MKNLIIATALAVTSIFAFAPASYAQGASVTITTGDGPRYHRQHDRPRYYRERERPRHVRDWQRPRHSCMTKKVRSYRNGHLVVKTTRVCR
ncbi:hypothetical protein KX729_13215 [Rhizobium sp. XQZ8]|uniref:hypothetical protein n=1 Tax=Rhizobium populisoli TaxID=2859785 RepID=UPI001CA5C858|nr:hypothetical protein [Rhizobium populisoli]MBW6422410.1 hypothetical protein [Rhizobium populisoli]